MYLCSVYLIYTEFHEVFGKKEVCLMILVQHHWYWCRTTGTGAESGTWNEALEKQNRVFPKISIKTVHGGVACLVK